ncbi:hypothetical protein H6F77_06670 [Microcoleus sp. FACHB-831]|uniref:hypothetical protein n=1 Tax=Microcoleus sp. FACHB-831 TaxID=2692827 RepID=UPI0016870BBB|nr:hypothetical protein [Microcoleus sp. FACHB-831]MBD1920767.1 hypothetical protein [Microcoleus sp. FACHB-831]
MRNFSLSVYTFHLCQTLADPLDRSSAKAELIWENLINIGKDLPFPELQETAFKSQLACYYLADKDSKSYKHNPGALNLTNEWLTRDEQPIKLTSIKLRELNISGSLQPFLLHDTYAFDLTLLLPEITPAQIKDLSINSLLFEKSVNFIGQTFWLYGQDEITINKCKDLAQEIIDKFLENTEYKGNLVKQGRLFEMPLFEYELINKATKESTSHYRLLVSINNKSISVNSDSYNWTRELLWTHHKVEYAYKQGRESYSEARKVYSQLEAKIKEFKPDQPLEELQKLLELMPSLSMQYQRQLRNLQAHYTTIKTNQINYQNYLQKFWQTGDISTWQEFGETTCKRYLDQIETYLSYIQPGKDLIGEFINTLRGLVEIEQAKCDREAEIREKNSDRELQQTLQDNERKEKKRDRELQNTVAIVGVGIGTAGVAATASPYLIAEKPDQKLTLIPFHFKPSFGLNPPHHLTLSVLFSLGAGLVGVAIASFSVRYIQKHPKSAIARTINLILGSSQEEEIRITELSNSQSPELLLSQQQEKERSPNRKNS